MGRLLALFTFVLLICLTAAGQGTNDVTTNDVARLSVTVLDVVPLHSFAGSLTPTSDVDPRFALTVRIDSCVPAITNMKSGIVITFAVHSPSRFLGGSAEKGETHQIEMSRKKAIHLLSANHSEKANLVDDPRYAALDLKTGQVTRSESLDGLKAKVSVELDPMNFVPSSIYFDNVLASNISSLSR